MTVDIWKFLVFALDIYVYIYTHMIVF